MGGFSWILIISWERSWEIALGNASGSRAKFLRVLAKSWRHVKRLHRGILRYAGVILVTLWNHD